MKLSLNGKKFYILLFSLICILIIFTLNKSFRITQPNNIRKLIEEKEYVCRCEETLKKFKEKYNKSPDKYKNTNVTLDDDKYVNTLKEIIQDKKYKNIRKYLPRILVYIIVVVIDIIFIIFWILFCCYSCRNVERQNTIGCGAKCSFIIYFILCIGVIGFCVVGFLFFPCLTKGLNDLACAVYKMVFHTIDGFKDKNDEIKWIGLNEIYNNITSLDSRDYHNGLEIIQNLNETFTEIKEENFNDFEDVLKVFDDTGLYISIGIFGGIALFNLLGLISMFFIFVCECKCMSCLFHLFWNIEIILIIGTFALSSGLGTFSIVSKDLSKILKYQRNHLDEPFILNFTEINSTLSVCLNENGDLINQIFGEERAEDFYTQMKGDSDEEIRGLYNCAYFRMDYNIITEELEDVIAKKLYFMSLLLIIIDVVGIVSIFIGITVYNSQKEYYPPSADNLNVNINNNRVINNRVDLSTENLKRQNNEVIFNKNIK